MNDYIILNGKPFEITTRKRSLKKTGALLESLNGKAVKDVLFKKYIWEFVIDGMDSQTLLRLEGIYSLNASLSFKDCDNEQYTVVWLDDVFAPVEESFDCYSISFSLRQV